MMYEFPRLTAHHIQTTDQPVVTSTNEMAKERLKVKDQPFLISARQQTAGHGKTSRKFYSPAGSGAYFTLALPFSYLAKSAGQVTVTAAVAAYEVLSKQFTVPITIKWVNDLYCERKKVVGILAEMEMTANNQPRGIVVGWGINLAAPTVPLPPALQLRAGWLGTTSIDDHQRLQIVDAVAAHFLDLLANASWKHILQVYQTHQYLINKLLLVDTGAGRVRGYFDHITDDGWLCVQTDNGPRAFMTGTVRELV
ncbi:biotin--[acetyl-CoA-carboxylase] ligase [Limosilactobacillus fermentum]|uniref:biotin--[acetyl-CoA-carboxylase] ligase n=1 Tax=Limosilactobacillus fermentum TaxID=1613 RepID=UPI0027CC2154|nr:biotin--[acetyl-CoA-carboxylase] ligase [Limosilactobacillus fermentum]MDQ2153573.1 biotin--[acetyl-CoA-carboxylase] ligase [Limosilactobacillus fermentum]